MIRCVMIGVSMIRCAMIGGVMIRFGVDDLSRKASMRK
jgi:hypothetical protein